VSAVSWVRSCNGSLGVVDSATKGVYGSVIEDISLRVESTNLRTCSVVVEIWGTHDVISIVGITLEERHVAISFTVSSTVVSSSCRGVWAVKSVVSWRGLSVVKSASEGVGCSVSEGSNREGSTHSHTFSHVGIISHPGSTIAVS